MGNRIFIGVKLNEETAEWLQSALPPLNVLQGVKLINYHITVMFLGPVPDVSTIVEKFEELRFEPFYVSVTGLGGFYKKGKLKIIYLKINPDNDALQELHQKVTAVFKEYDNEQFPVFAPHITLNRNIKTAQIDEIGDFVNYKFPQPLEFEVGSLQVMDSGNFQHTRVYEVVSSLNFGPNI